MKIINAAKNFHLLPDWSSETIPVELMSRAMHRESKVYIVGGEVHQKVSKDAFTNRGISNIKV